MDERDERKQKSPSLPPNYVSFAQLRDQWLQKQQQQQNQEKAVSENAKQIPIVYSDSEKKKKKNRYPKSKNNRYTTPPNDYENSTTSIQPQKNSNEETLIGESSGGGGGILSEKVLPRNGLKEGFRKAGRFRRNQCNDGNNKEYRVKLQLEKKMESKEKDNGGEKLVLKGNELEINLKNKASDIADATKNELAVVEENAKKGEIGKEFRRYGNRRRPNVGRSFGQLRERMDKSKYPNIEKVNGGMELGLKDNEMEINSKNKSDIEGVCSKVDGLKGIGKNDQNHTVQGKGLSVDTTKSSMMRSEFAVAEDNAKKGEIRNEFSSIANGQNHTLQEEKGLSDDTMKSSMFDVVEDNAKKGEIEYELKSKNGQNHTVLGKGLSEDTTESSMKRNEVVWVEKNAKKGEIRNEFRRYGNMRTPYVRRSSGHFRERMGISNYTNYARVEGSSGNGKVWVKKEGNSCANSAEISSSAGISQVQD